MLGTAVIESNTDDVDLYIDGTLVGRLSKDKALVVPSLSSGLHEAEFVDAERLLVLVGLGDKTGRYPSELSGGEQQRVAIARAFINQPAVLLADEPTGNLDEETEADIIGVIERLNREQKTTIIMVTHNTELAAHASRQFRMKHGVLVETNESV
jgi:predicted ABC-type transport system involved in lysophospholipase L1 biosynthesis ATPase subunit